MLNKIKNLRKSQSGFTIIEVMIVLAIAGMIILVVLLAIPALQRNARNTAIKQDAGAIAGGISEFATNNDGALANATSNQAGSVLNIRGAAGTTATTAKVQASTIVTFVANSATAVTGVAGRITVDFGAKCPATVTGTTVTPVISARATAIIYSTETAAGTVQVRCLDS